ncbi:MAG: hypothetical protein WCG85_25635 [Polyangia bacterium]
MICECRWLAIGLALSLTALACSRTPMYEPQGVTTNTISSGGGAGTVTSQGATGSIGGTTDTTTGTSGGGTTSTTGGTTSFPGGATSAGGTTASGGMTSAGGTTTAGGTSLSGGSSGSSSSSGGSSAFPGAGGSADAGSSPGTACPCSRRPGENSSFMCPRGTGHATSASIGTKGGTVTLNGTPSTMGVPVTLVIPANDLSQSVVVTITETTLSPPAGYVDESPVYDIEGPTGTTLSTPATVSMPFQNNLSFVASQLSIYTSTDGITYSRIQDSYLNAGFLQGSLSKFGFLFAGYPQTAADLAACSAP